MAFGSIKAVGLEVEGPWRSAPKVEGHVMEFKQEHMPPCQTEAAHEVKHYMECVSDILRFPKHVDDFFDQIKKHWVDKAIVPGMGFHVHFSLVERKHYDLLFTKHFNATFFNELFNHFKNDKELLARPNYRSPQGTNFFVMEHPDQYWVHRIAHKRKAQDPDRYYALNFWCAFNDHETFEIRIFPSNSIEKMRAYVDWTIDFINQYIRENEGNEQINLQLKCIPEPVPVKAIISKKVGDNVVDGEVELIPRKKVEIVHGEIPWKNLNNPSTGGKADSFLDEIQASGDAFSALFG